MHVPHRFLFMGLLMTMPISCHIQYYHQNKSLIPFNKFIFMLSYIKLHNLKKVISCKKELIIIPALFYLLKLQQNIEKLKFGQYYADSPALLNWENTETES